MTRRFACVRVVLGVLLLAAAGLKLSGLGVSAVPRVGWYAQPWVQLVAAEWELVLGVWLLSGSSPRAAWFAAVLTFLSFAAVSCRLGAAGVASCGCFGTVKASPWAAFAVDAAALALLAVARPDFRAAAAPPGRGWFAVAAGAAAVLLVVGGAGAAVFGSPDAALARLRGEAVAVSPGHLDFGEGRPGEQLEAAVEVRNWTGDPVRLIGGTADCSCVVTAGLPATIPPGGSVTVPVRLRLPAGTGGAFTRVAVLTTDCDRAREVRLTLGARVAGGPAAGR